MVFLWCFLWWCGDVFCGGVVVFLWWCGGVFVAVFLWQASCSHMLLTHRVLTHRVLT